MRLGCGTEDENCFVTKEVKGDEGGAEDAE